jgi:hypothetical protein
VEPAAADVHRAAARAFIDRPGVDPRCREALSLALEDSSEGWWAKWQTTVRTEFPGCLLAWAEHRRQTLQTLLEARLREVTADESAARAAYSAVSGSRLQRRHPESPARANPEGALPPTRQAQGRPTLFAVVQAAIGNMSERELRQLWLPVGVLLDAIEKDSKN